MKNKNRLFLSTIIWLICLIPIASASDQFSIEDYGQLPDVRSLSISPDGKHYAYIKRGYEGDLFVVIHAESGHLTGGASAGDIKARRVYFATNKHVILMGSMTESSLSFHGKWEHSGAISYNLETKEMKVLLNGMKDLYLAQGGLGRIVGLNQDEEVVYMPAYVGQHKDPQNHLMRIDLNTGKGRAHARGTMYTRDWFVDRVGNVLAREDYDERKQEHKVLSRVAGKWKIIYTKKTSVPDISILAVSKDNKQLIFNDGDGELYSVFSMALEDGEIGGPLYEVEGKDIDQILTTGLNREFDGIQYSGLVPEYQFEEAIKNKHFLDIQDLYPTSSVRPVSATGDWSSIVFKISGNQAAIDHVIYTPAKRNVDVIGSGYPTVSTDQIGAIKAMRYKARDGLSITAIVTWPVGVAEKTKLPLLVLPHGGPASYDSIEFYWWAQYFARRGYLVLQPNFRGSAGYGVSFRKAGHRKWGKEMQHDITDGVKAMIEAGYADPSRVCIMGASYGGYAALAGGAFTPELYRCVISVGGVSDMSLMLEKNKMRYGRRDWVNNYWNEVIGDSNTGRDKLKDISPANFADQFKAPVLLLHGQDDSIVPINQSKRMAKRLRSADKQVKLITLKGEDRWLSSSDTRLQLLEAISTFLDVHNPAE